MCLCVSVHVCEYEWVWCGCGWCVHCVVPSLQEAEGATGDSTSLFNISSEDQTVLQLYAGGVRDDHGCQLAPLACGLVEQFDEAALCTRGEVNRLDHTHLLAHFLSLPHSRRSPQHMYLAIATHTNNRMIMYSQ